MSGEVAGRTPPQSIEAEQSVLGALLLDNAAWDKVADLIGAGDFYTQDHRVIFQYVGQLIEQNRPADTLTVAEILQRSGKLEEVGGQAYLGQLSLNTPSAANVRRYAEIVRDRSIMRALASAATRIAESVYNPQGRDAKTLLDEAQSAVMAVGERARRGQGDFEKADQVIAEVTQFVDSQHARYVAGKANDVIGVPTGFVDLDHKTTGLQPGELILLAARPAMGKSALAVNIAEGAARRTGRWALMFSLEMPNRSLGLRLLAAGAKVNVQRLVTGRVYDDEWDGVAKASHDLRDVKIAFKFSPGLTISEMRAAARRGVRELGEPCLIVVDYLQLMMSGETESNRATQLADISRGLKLLAGELDVPVLALSQLNRELEKRVNKRPVMSDLRDSGALEQDADVILFIYRDEVYRPDSADPGKAEIIIAKQRNGPTGVVPLTFRGDFTRFDNYASLER